MLSAKTLKYNHIHNCPAKKQSQQSEQPQQPAQSEQPNMMQTVNERLQKLRNDRAVRNQERVKHLIAQAF